MIVLLSGVQIHLSVAASVVIIQDRRTRRVSVYMQFLCVGNVTVNVSNRPAALAVTVRCEEETW